MGTSSPKELFLLLYYAACLFSYVNQQGDYMDKKIRIAQYVDGRMVSPVEENFMTIDGTTYATGKGGGVFTGWFQRRRHTSTTRLFRSTRSSG